MRVQAMIDETGGDGMAETDGQKYLQHLSIFPPHTINKVL